MSLIDRPTRRDLLRYGAGAGLAVLARQRAQAALKWNLVRQSAPAASVTSGAMQTFTVSSAAPGNMLVLCITSRSTTIARPLNTITLGNASFNSLITRTYSSSPLFKTAQIAAGLVSGSGSSGTSLSLQFTGSVLACCINLSEWSGASFLFPNGDLSSGTNSGNGTTAAPVGGFVSYRNDLFISSVGYASTTPVGAIPSNYTALTPVNDGTGMTLQPAYQIGGPLGIQSPSFTIPSSAWGALFEGYLVTTAYRSQGWIL